MNAAPDERRLDRLGASAEFGDIALMLIAWMVFWHTNIFTTFGQTPDKTRPQRRSWRSTRRTGTPADRQDDPGARAFPAGRPEPQ